MTVIKQDSYSLELASEAAFELAHNPTVADMRNRLLFVILQLGFQFGLDDIDSRQHIASLVVGVYGFSWNIQNYFDFIFIAVIMIDLFEFYIGRRGFTRVPRQVAIETSDLLGNVFMRCFVDLVGDPRDFDRCYHATLLF